MILKGSQRSGGLKLAAHLTNDIENDHVEVHDLRGFTAGTLNDAFREAEAIAKGTKCTQYLFSLSLSPPETENVTVAEFEAAITKAETALGLTGQARAIVFHEKEGRRHAHAVWSRIDVMEMKAINLPHYKRKLNTVSKELFLEHGWRLPDGFRDRNNRNPLNYSLVEWQQAKRSKQDPQRLKMMFRECWAISDSRAGFERALEERGYHLATGGRRTLVAVDYQGKVWSLSRWTGQNTKALKEKLGESEDLPTVDQVKTKIAARMTDTLRDFIAETQAAVAAKADQILEKKRSLRQHQRKSREDLRAMLKDRHQREAVQRAARFRTGARGIWDWISGKTRKIKQQNKIEVKESLKRDAIEQDTLIAKQLAQRQHLQRELRQMKREAAKDIESLHRDIAHYQGLARSDDSDDLGAARKLRKSKIGQAPIP